MAYITDLVLCEIANNKFDELSNFLSKQQINDAISSLIIDDYIDSDLNLLSKSDNILSSYKTKRVILNSAGLGSRLRPLTNSTPKPLIEVHGKPIIEHTIQNIIKNTKISEVVIVVWWLKDKFNYLIDKYKNEINIKLVENFEALEKNNISTFEKIKYITHNAYIIDGDMIIKNNIIRDYVPRSTLFVKYSMEKTKEWVLDVTDFNVNSISIGGENNYYITGVSFISQNESQILTSQVDLEYKNNLDHVNMYWDDLLIKTISELNLKYFKIDDEDLIEIDNLDELLLIDKSYNKIKTDDITKIKNIINSEFFTTTDLILNLNNVELESNVCIYSFTLLDSDYIIALNYNEYFEILNNYVIKNKFNSYKFNDKKNYYIFKK